MRSSLIKKRIAELVEVSTLCGYHADAVLIAVGMGSHWARILKWAPQANATTSASPSLNASLGVPSGRKLPGAGSPLPAPRDSMRRARTANEEARR